MAVNLGPAERSFKASFLSFDCARLSSNLSTILADSSAYFSHPLDTGDWKLFVKDGKTGGRGSPAEAVEKLTACPADTVQFLLRLFVIQKTPRMGLEKIPEEHLTISVDFARKSFQLSVSVLGETNAMKIFEVVTKDLILLQTIIPPNHHFLEPYLRNLLADHSPIERNIFLIMRFKEEKPFQEIVVAIQSVCATHGLNVLRADDKAYTDDLWDNVMTYAYGSITAIAVFDHINYREFNPNVSLEIGFMLAQCKRVLLLKDKSIPVMPTDIIGKIYRPFDTYEPQKTIVPQVEKWLADCGLGS
jgi:hypothetical protein